MRTGVIMEMATGLPGYDSVMGKHTATKQAHRTGPGNPDDVPFPFSGRIDQVTVELK